MRACKKIFPDLDENLPLGVVLDHESNRSRVDHESDRSRVDHESDRSRVDHESVRPSEKIFPDLDENLPLGVVLDHESDRSE